MATELRSPHQRRSDQLSILTRRPGPLQPHGRFSKTLTEATCVKAFDPAFDSDADTEGPASGSSIWRRDFSRIMSNSSGGVQSDAGGTDVEAVASAAGVEKLRTDSMDARSMSNESGGGMPGGGAFARERACSFYGEGDEEEVADQGDDIGPVTKAMLKDVLSEDYELYSAGIGGKGARVEGDKDADADADADVDVDVDVDVGVGEHEHGHENDNENENGNENLGRDGVGVDVEGSERKEKEKEEEKREEGLGRAKSVPINMVGVVKQPKASKKARSVQWFGEEIRLRMDSGSGLETDEVEKIGREVEMFLESLERQRLCSVAMPLFVEEVGRIPRAAIVEGRMKRVKICEEEGRARDERRGGLCGILMCFEGERSKKKRRKKKKKKALENVVE